jgi:transmembrane sensor
MRSIGRPPAAPAVQWDEQAIWQRIRRRMPWHDEARGLAQSPAGPRRGRAPMAFGWVPPARWSGPAIAAGLALLAASALLGSRAGGEPRGAAAPVVSADREIRTVRGQRAVVDLGDGTRVTLGPESRVRIPASFQSSSGPREVELVGQGHFAVRHDDTRPFRVRTHAGIAEDLGTEFVVTAHAETRGMQVVVTDGVVALRRHGSPPASLPLVTLARGNLGTLDESGTATVTTVSDLSRYTAWTHGEIRFAGTPLGEALPVLARWYGVRIHLADRSLAARRITASFTDQSADDVVDALSLLLGLRVRRNDDSITLYAR